MIKLYEWQERDVQTLEDNGFVGLNNSQPGAGKTPVAVECIRRSGSELTLVIAPKSTHSTAWIPTVKGMLGEDARVLGRSRKAEREALVEFELGFPGIYLITPQLFTRSDVSQWAGDLLICDEAHMLGNPSSVGQRKLSGFTSMSYDNPISQRFPQRIALTGTPMRNSFDRMWSLTRFLWPELNKRGQIAHSNSYMWKADRMTSAEITTGYDSTSGKRKTAKKWLREREPGRLLSEMPCVVGHYRRERCCEYHPEGFLPLEEPQVITREVELTTPQKKAIQELQDHAITWLEDNPLVSKLPITTLTRIRQLCLGEPTVTWEADEETGEDIMHVDFDEDCKSPMIDETLSILESLDEGENVVVYMESSKFASVMTERLRREGFRTMLYSGQVDSRQRNEELRKFGTPEGAQVLVGVLSAISTGTDGAQRVANTEIWVERSLDATTNIQAEARLDRMGARKQVQRFLVQDDEGYAAGRLGRELEKRLEIRQSTIKGAA